MNEIKLSQLEIKYELPSIEVDLAPLKAEVDAIVEQYQGWIVQEDDLESAKKTIAKLNSTAKALNDKGIEIERAIAKPITDLRESLKVLTKRLESVSKEIKTQTETYEEQRKIDKRNEILSHEHWASYMVFDEKWLNKTFAIKDVEVELLRQKGVFQNNCLLITATCEGLGLAVDKYLQQLVNRIEVNQIIANITNDNQVKKQYQNVVEAPQTVETPIKAVDTSDTSTYPLTLRFTATRTQLNLLKEFLIKNSIKYEKVE
jgi:hypothetical protein